MKVNGHQFLETATAAMGVPLITDILLLTIMIGCM